MAFLDIFKKKTEKPLASGYKYAPTLSGGTPFYSSFGDNVYASDIVVQSIRCKANEFKKLKPRHIVTKDNQMSVRYDSSIARCLRRPNEYMTTADFLEKITILLELNKNVFIYPQYYITQSGEKFYTGLYPLKPSNVEYLIDKSNRYFIHLCFANGYDIMFPANDIVHWRKDYGVNDYFGGGMCGGDDNKGLMRAITEYDRLCQSIAKAVACSCQVNGLVKYNTYLDDEKMEEKRAEFEQKLSSGKSGVLFTDNKTEYTHMPRDVKLVDAETLKFFYETILRANGTSLAILNGDYTKSQKEAYYEHALEGDIKSLGQALTKCIFSDRETAYGNEIVLYPNDISFMSMENKITALQAGLPAGIFTKNEARELLGYPPIEGGDVMPRGYNEIDSSSNTGESTSVVDETQKVENDQQ